MNDFEQNFFNADGNLKRLPNEFYFDLLKFKDYHYDKNIKHICTKVDVEFQVANNIETVKCNSLIILYELLKLREKLESIYTDFYKSCIFLDNQFSERDIEKYTNLIINWCVKYGYPFANNLPNDRGVKAHRLFVINEKNYSFSLMDFLVSLNDIYSLYLIYLVVVGNKKTISNNAYISTNDLPVALSDLKNISNLSTEEYETIFEEKYNSINLKSIITFDEKNYPYISIKANNLFEAAAYQIALMMYNPEEEIRICPICKETFIPKNPRQKYCNNEKCTPQLAYKRRKSAERKRQKSKPESI